MKPIHLLLSALFILSVARLRAQHIFPEQYIECATDHFALESDTTNAKMDKKELAQLLMSAWDETTVKKIRGMLLLQIIVDLEGKSCLISLDNRTNIKTEQLQLKETVDKNLVWGKPSQKVAAIVRLQFKKRGVEVKRFGVNAYR